MDDQENAAFLEIISRLESPRELGGQVRFQVKLIRREEENFIESQAIERLEQSPSLMSGETVSAEDQEQEQQQDQPYEVVT